MQTGPNASTLIDGWIEGGRGDATVLITSDDRTMTAAELHEAVCRFATGLASLGVGREDRVVLVLDDTPAFPTALLPL